MTPPSALPQRLGTAPPRPEHGVGWSASDLAVAETYRQALERSLAIGPRPTVAAYYRVLRRCAAVTPAQEDPLTLMALLLEHATGRAATTTSNLLFLVGQAGHLADRDSVTHSIAKFLDGCQGIGGAALPRMAARADHLRFLMFRDSPRTARRYAERAESAYLAANERIPDVIARTLDTVAPAAPESPGKSAAAARSTAPIPAITLADVRDLLHDAALDESEHKTKDLTEVAIRRRVERARIALRAGKTIQRSLDRMLVDAMQGNTWTFDVGKVRDWIAAHCGAAEERTRIVDEILELSASRDRAG